MSDFRQSYVLYSECEDRPVREVGLTENMTLRSVKRWLTKEKTDPILGEDAFTRLYENTYLSVFRYIFGLNSGLQQEAEDLTAETYVRAWRTRQRFHGDDHAALGWLLRIAKNLVIDLSRRREVREVDEEINIEWLVDKNQTPELNVITREQIVTVWRLLGTLPETTREMLVLRYMLGWQVKQIAEYLETNENRVSVTIRRALTRLRHDWSQLQEKDNE